MQRIKKLAIALLAVFFVGLVPLTAAEMTVSWEWLLDDPDVTVYRYQMGGEDPEGWTEVSADTNTYTVEGLDPYQEYTLYLQRSYDGVNWSETATSTAKAVLTPRVVEEEPVPVVAEPEEDSAIVVEEEPPVTQTEDASPVAVVAETPVEPVAAAEQPNAFAFSLLFKPGVMFDTSSTDGEFAAADELFKGEFGIALEFANILKAGNYIGFGLRTDILANFIGYDNGETWSLADALDYLNINNYAGYVSIDLKLMFEATVGPAFIYLGVGAGLGAQTRADYSFGSRTENNIFTKNGFGMDYFLSGLIGVRFYINDMFSLGVEGGYRYLPSKDDFLDGSHLFSADLVLGVTF